MPPAKRTGDRLPRDAYILTIRQSPEAGKALTGKEKDRKPVDPPPIIQLQIRDFSDPAQNYLQSPYYLCIVSLWDATNDEPAEDPVLMGTLVSSLHRLKDVDNRDAGFFVFPDLSVKNEGEFRLKFVLWELLEGEMESLQSIISKPFKVHASKSFPGLAESTFLTRSFSDQGVRLRIRKETRAAIKRSVSDAETGAYSQADASAIVYGAANQYHNYGVDYSMVKRQKSAGGDSWSYTHPQPSSALYAHHSHTQASSYYPEPVTAAPQVDYGFRNTGTSDGNVSHLHYARVGDYSQPSHSLPYHSQARQAHADMSNGSYGEHSNYSSVPSNDQSTTLSPLTPRSTELSGSQVTQQSYRYGVHSHQIQQQQHPTVLPPISTASNSAGSTAMLNASSGYPNYPSSDARFNLLHHSGARQTYGTYPGQAYQAPASYT